MKKRVWALLDNRMGSVGQIRGVAAALNPAHYEIEEKQIAYNRLAALPNILKGRTLVGVIFPTWSFLPAAGRPPLPSG